MAGDDLAIGGRDADDIKGDAGEDILIAGFTVYDADAAALDAVLAKWIGTPNDYVSRVQRVTKDTGSIDADPFLLAGVTVFDDQSADKMTGGSGRDVFFADLDGEDDDDDLVKDRKTKDDEEFLFDLGELLP